MKTYVVTGATSGVGKALISSFKKEDIKVIAIGRDQAKLDALVEYMGKDQCVGVKIDLSNISSIHEILSAPIDVVDALIYCAGFNKLIPLRKSSYDDFIKIMNVNFFAFTELVRILVSKKPKDHRMRIIAVSSRAALTVSKNNYMYASSKAALDAFVRNIALDYASANVEINTLQPGYIDTPMLDPYRIGFGEDFDKFITSHQPLGLISVEDMVEEIRYMLNKKSNKVSGTAIKINAGNNF